MQFRDRVMGNGGWIASVCCGALTLLMTACDAQAASDYRGESLLTVHGTVEILEPRTPGRLVPVLMFDTGYEFSLIDVRVKGQFPSDFQLDIYEQPPAQVLQRASPDAPLIALGYISAVPENHPESIRLATWSETGLALEVCPQAGCEIEASWCTVDGECYIERRACPSVGSPREACKVIETEGDPRLMREPWEMFAGFSQNYLVAYAGEHFSPDSEVARVLQAKDGLDAGYHLVAMRETTEAERAQALECESRAENLALARVNETRGTAYTLDHFKTLVCYGRMDCAPGDSHCIALEMEPRHLFCDLPVDERVAIETEYDSARRRAQVELQCPPDAWVVLTHVPDPAQERITVVLGPDSKPKSSRPGRE